MMRRKKKKKKNVEIREELREVVIDTFNGKYGIGFERKENLEKAGYNYMEVQEALNQYIIDTEIAKSKRGFFRKLFKR